MKKIRLALLFLLFGVMPNLLHPSPAWAVSDVIHLRGQGASAYFSSFDSSGCTATDVFVQFGEIATKNPPAQANDVLVATMFISQFDYCTGTQLLLASPASDIVLSMQAAQISKKLDSAGLDATIEIFDYVSGQNINPEVHLTWTATNDPPNRNNSHFHFHGGNFILNSHSQSLSRSAQVAGSVTLNFMNLTPEATTGTLESARSGETQILHQ